MTTHFKNGVKYVDGHAFASLGTKEHLSSNGTTKYTTVLWEDHTLSCNCPGWPRKKTKAEGCRHTREGVDAGIDMRVDVVDKSNWRARSARVEASPPKKRKILL